MEGQVRTWACPFPFMFKPSRRLQKWYEKYNKLYWDGRLTNVTVGWDSELKGDREGLTISIQEVEDTTCLFHQIHLNENLKEASRNYVLMTLLHELCHVACYPYMKHGRLWQNEMKRIAMNDAFEKLW